MPSSDFDLFPVARALPESEQIGRKAFIDQVEGAVRHGANVLLMEERRTGKSSVARAVIERLREEEPAVHVGLMVDLTRSATSSGALAQELVKEARRHGGLGKAGAALLSAQSGKAKAVSWGKGKADQLAAAVGEDAEVAGALAELLPDGAAPTLANVLEALDKRAQSQGLHVTIFIDEIQQIAGWEDAGAVKAAIAAVSERHGTRVNFIFAGSEQSAIDAMFGDKDPLDFFGDRLELPEISRSDWIKGLGERFAAAKLSIDPAQLEQILLETDRHPGRTIAVCRRVLAIIPGDVVTVDVVKQAIALHRSDPQWKRLT